MEKTKSISLILGVLIMSIFIVYLVFAWTEPPYGGTCTNPPCPPGGNVPAPLNVSLNAQSKEGALVIGTNSGLTTGLIVQYGKVGIGTTGPAGTLHVRAASTDAIVVSSTTGNVGIGTTGPGAKLEVAGQIKITGGSPGAGKVLTSSDASGLASWRAGRRRVEAH